MKFNGDASLIEVVGVSTLNRVSRKRSSGMFLAVDVNLLPADYTQQDFQDNTQVTPYTPCPTFPLVCAYIVVLSNSFISCPRLHYG